MNIPNKQSIKKGDIYEEQIIKPNLGWAMVDWRELWHYRDLLYLLVWRDIKIQYTQTALGIGWAWIGPFVGMIIFTILFGNLMQVDSEGVPYAIFSYTALVPWTFFSNALTGASSSLSGNMGLITKVYFPRIILPLVAIFNKLLDFFIAFLLLIVLMIWFQIWPTFWVVLLPLLILQMMLFALGIGLWTTASAVQYRDVNRIVGFGLTILMYASPVIYPVSLIPEQYRLIYGLNPMVSVIEGFRSTLLGTNPMPWDLFIVGTVVTLSIVISGIFVFHRLERSIIDVA
jgi:lipopolysaccharide transport system permease protein